MKKIQDWWCEFSRKHRTSIRFLVPFWIIYILFNVLLYYQYTNSFKDLLRIFINYPSWGLIVFIPSYYILRKLILRGKYVFAILATIINIIIYLSIRYWYNVYVFPEVGIEVPYTKKFELFDFMVGSLYAYLNNIILAYGYGFARHAIDLEVRERKLTEANAKLQHQKDMTQIAFLQAQINPHFLYNTLNFIYSEAIMVSDSVAESIMTLSNIMRYTLTETGNDTLVSLYSEINHIKNYLKIQKMRFSNELYIDLIIKGEENINHLEILPLVLISFVENIFKHGDIHNPAYPAKIMMNVEENSFFLSIYNRKNKGPKEHTSGVGMNNIRTRMEILYAEKYQVKILTDTEDEFAIEFTISDMEEAFRNLKKYKIFNN